MQKMAMLLILGICAAVSAPVTAPATAQGQSMSFFVSSTGSGMGGNLGGLAGADKHCQTIWWTVIVISRERWCGSCPRTAPLGARRKALVTGVACAPSGAPRSRPPASALSRNERHSHLA